jgi:hypothetical protein
MYGQRFAMGVPASSLGIMLDSVWMVFAAITATFVLISAWQLVRPAGDHPRP